MHNTLQKIESAAIFLASLYFYNTTGESWWLYVGLWLVPDIGMVGYLKNSKLGALTYNSFHSYLVPALLLIVSSVNAMEILQAISIIWISHIALDRALGYGLKLDKGFNHTHLGTIGKK